MRITLTFLILSSLLLATPTAGQLPKIVFASNRSGTWQIYSMDEDGSHVTRLTYLPGDNVTPTLSADNRTIAFTHFGHSAGLGTRDIYIMNSDGAHLRRFTTPPLSGELPSLSRDGRSVTFAGWLKGIGVRTGAGVPTIFVGNVDGSNLVNTDRVGSAPSFDPFGLKVVFTCQDARSFSHICLMRADGSDLITLTDLGTYQSAPRFSLDGRTIVYEDCQLADVGCSPYAVVYIMGADGSNRHRIESMDSRGEGAAFISDGRIVYGRPRLVGTPNYWAEAQVCLMNLDGTHEHCLTRGPARNEFSPFGVVF